MIELMLCHTCTKRLTCKQLCKNAEKYVNQNCKSQRESPYSPIPINEFGNTPLDNISHHVSKWTYSELAGYFIENAVNFPFITPLQNKVLKMKFFDGLTYKQIAQKLNGGCNPLTSIRLSVEDISYLIRSAKRTILHIYSKSKGGNV